MTATIGLDQAALRELRRSVTGALIAPGDDAYEAARHVWNGMIDKRPAVVAPSLSGVQLEAAGRRPSFAATASRALPRRGGNRR